MPAPSTETSPPVDAVRESRIGLAYGLAAYISWGLAPAYYKLLGDVTPIQILAHRVFWSAIFLVPLLAHRRLWGAVRRALSTRKTFLTLFVSTIMISTNWFTFIYSVSTNQVVQAALGYYMNPLVVVLLGVVFLKERLRLWQIVSLSLAAASVVILTIAQGGLPVISLILAVSFAVYGYLRKTVDAGPMVGLFIETLILLPVAIALMVWNSLSHGPWRSSATYGILACAGIITAVPLLWFANAAKRLRLATMGLLQYLAPTGSFLLAVIFFHEPFTPMQRVAFPMIWLALAVYSIDSYRAFRASIPTPDEPVLSDL